MSIDRMPMLVEAFHAEHKKLGQENCCVETDSNGVLAKVIYQPVVSRFPTILRSANSALLAPLVHGIGSVVMGTRYDYAVELEYFETSNASIRHYFELFEGVRHGIEEFNIRIDELTQLTDQLVTSSNDETGIQNLFKSLNQAQNRSLIALKSTVEELTRSNELRDDTDNGEAHCSSLERRIRSNLTTHLARLTSLAAQSYQTCMTNHTKVLQQRSERRLKLLVPNVVGSMDLEEVLQLDPDEYNRLLVHENMGEQRSLEAKMNKEYLGYCCEELEEKLRDVRALENNVEALHSLFVDLAAMVDRGQLLVNSIELELLTAADYAVEVNQALAKAKLIQRKRNKRAMRFSGVFVVTLLAVILAIVISSSKG